jgi:hypothetical protein
MFFGDFGRPVPAYLHRIVNDRYGGAKLPAKGARNGMSDAGKHVL